MTVRILPLRRIVQNACWPLSGRRYSVWEGDRCILETDVLSRARAVAEEG